MSEVALLNPQVEAAAAKAMINVAATRLGNLQQALTASVLDRETYLQKIGAATELDRLLADMQREYARHFEV
jgi:hypothetical protein